MSWALKCKVRIAFPHPALLLDCGKRYLVVADLHIGFERRFGVAMASNLEEMAEEINGLKDELGFDELVILGDVKDSIRGVSGLERKWLREFFGKLRVGGVIVPGNHDGGLGRVLPNGFTLADRRGIRIGDTALVHGHTLPSLALSPSKRIVMGHIHPTYNREGSPLSGSPVWLVLKVKREAFFEGKGCLDVIVMPAFNRALACWGYSPRRIKSSPMVRRLREHLKDCWIVTLKGELIGRLDEFGYVI